MKHLKRLGVTALLFGFLAVGASTSPVNPQSAILVSVNHSWLSSPAAPDLKGRHLRQARTRLCDRLEDQGAKLPRTAAVVPKSSVMLILLASGLLALVGGGRRRRRD